jgi:hypothetical protein
MPSTPLIFTALSSLTPAFYSSPNEEYRAAKSHAKPFTVEISRTLVDQLSGLECVMRWILVCLGSLATGVLTIVLSLALLLVSLFVYGRYVLGIAASNESVGWDPVSLFGRYWKLGVIGIPLLIFGLGCGVGFWFLSKRLHG